jgi:hypothetical protein
MSVASWVTLGNFAALTFACFGLTIGFDERNGRMSLSTKSDLLNRIGDAWKGLDELVSALPETRLTTAGPDGWSVKDHLAHISAWEESLIALLEGRDRDAAVGLVGPEAESAGHDVDAINAAIQRRSKERSASDVLTTFLATHTRCVARIEALSDEDLARPYSHYQPNDLPPNANPVIGWIAGNTYEHYDEHASWIAKLLTNL